MYLLFKTPIVFAGVCKNIVLLVFELSMIIYIYIRFVSQKRFIQCGLSMIELQVPDLFINICFWKITIKILQVKNPGTHHVGIPELLIKRPGTCSSIIDRPHCINLFWLTNFMYISISHQLELFQYVDQNLESWNDHFWT